MGYLGMVGGPDPCAVQVESIRAARPTAFRDSPYGVSHEFFPPVATQRWVPYLIDPVTLEIEWREDLITPPFSEGLALGAVLNDTTMIYHDEFPTSGPGPYTAELRVLSRSGITITMSGAQHSVGVALPETSVIRLDSTHFLRRYNEPGGTPNVVVQVFSVSGSTISLVASTSYFAGAPVTVTRDGGEAGTPTLFIGTTLFPFHWDGAGTLHCFGFGAGFFGLPRIHAVPFSLGGSITPPGLTWRSRDSQTIQGAIVATKVGSSECLLHTAGGGGGRAGFYDDGAQMHYNGGTIVADACAEETGGDGESTWGDYLTSNVVESPAGTTANSGSALITQSGTSLGYTPLDIIVRCPDVTGNGIAGTQGPTRHDTALGAVSYHLGGGVYRLYAFRW